MSFSSEIGNILRPKDSTGARNKRNGNNLQKRGHPAASPIWRIVALSLLTLCLMLVMGLVTLGIMFLQMSNDINSDSENVNPLQKIIHQQQDNVSQQLDSSKKMPMNDSLQSLISNLLEKQGQMATRLCRELLIHTSDHKCNPCPKSWQWHESSCYYFIISEEKTWSDSRKDCADKNATMVKIDSIQEKDFLQSQPLSEFSFFWLGLSWDQSRGNWLWEDGSFLSPFLLSNKEHAQMNGSTGCAYFERGNIYISRCSAEISWICEKTTSLVKIEDLD